MDERNSDFHAYILIVREAKAAPGGNAAAANKKRGVMHWINMARSVLDVTLLAKLQNPRF